MRPGGLKLNANEGSPDIQLLVLGYPRGERRGTWVVPLGG